jgi:hypothetical protein
MLVKAIRRKLESPIPVPETLSTFHLRAHNEPLSVVVMSVRNPDRSNFVTKTSLALA